MTQARSRFVSVHYREPSLTTTQTETLRTDSPTPSEHSNDNFDRTRFDREEARRRFEPAVVGAKDVNFSHAVGGRQKSYTSRHRRRRRAQRSNGLEAYGDISDESDTEAEESLGQKLARLKREAEEVRLEIERRGKDDGEFQDSFEHQQGSTDHEDNDLDLTRGVNDVSRILDGLHVGAISKHGSLEQEFGQRLAMDNSGRKQPPQAKVATSNEQPTPSAISAITTFSDRLTAIESSLGLSAISPASNPTTILQSLDTLTNQINLLHTTIIPKPTPSTTLQPPTTASPSNLTPQLPHLDILQSRLHTLHQSATSLLSTRKAAQTALTDLETVRLRGIRTADHLARYQTLANRRANRGQQQNTINPHPSTADSDIEDARPTSRDGNPSHRTTTTEEAKERIEIADEIITPLFLEDQAEKIKALYNVLPTIQNLQPLLPVVLERLRGLSVVHAGAAEARNDMDELEARLKTWEGEMARWREAVEGVESGIDEMKGVMRENVEVVGGLVRGVEDRVGTLERGAG